MEGRFYVLVIDYLLIATTSIVQWRQSISEMKIIHVAGTKGKEFRRIGFSMKEEAIIQ
ncbi:hypothetical protein M8C21_029766 [Ambrosia artemisiifolia]|uniref:Uncharacterized protein n=1 Tax=Ambrosia artemisiifolia TaxID=4212 RepID=A0AAD5C228_AMBAR|nr:hypothetical protein M8C21_029766 [Ambrosia artemisiifolia]